MSLLAQQVIKVLSVRFQSFLLFAPLVELFTIDRQDLRLDERKARKSLSVHALNFSVDSRGRLVCVIHSL